MANTKVEIRISTTASKEVYIVGSTASLGLWNPAKAVKLEYDEEKRIFHTTKLLPLGELVEFKVLSGKSWDAVEKGWYEEEVPNHLITPQKDLIYAVEIPRFSD